MESKEIKERLESMKNLYNNLNTRKIQLETRTESIQKEIKAKHEELAKETEALGYSIKSVDDAIAYKEKLEVSIEEELSKIEPKISEAKELLRNDCSEV